jgi:hypothetical protein
MTDSTPPHVHRLVSNLVAGAPGAGHAIITAAETSCDPVLLAAAAVLSGDPGLTDRAAHEAATSRDRQLAAVVTAYVAGDADRVDVLVRDHLSEHPDSLLAAWIAGLNTHRHHTTR